MTAQEGATFEPFLSSNSWGTAIVNRHYASDPQTEEDKTLVEICRRLLANMRDGKCTMTYEHRDGKLDFDMVEINGKGSTIKKSLSRHKSEQPAGPDRLKPNIVLQCQTPWWRSTTKNSTR